MGLLLPTPTVTLGPLWATQVVQAFTTIDSHNHSSGQGVQIPTAGIALNADLAFNSFNATLLRSSRMVNQGSPLITATDLTCLYASGGNLYYNNAGGAQIQITAGSALNAASIGGIGGDYTTSTASVFYTSASSLFTFLSSPNVASKMLMGDIKLTDATVASGNAVTLRTVPSLASNYSLTLPPAVPGATAYLALDPTGAITSGRPFALNKILSSSCGYYVTTSATMADVTNLVVTITTLGNPVFLFLIADGSAAGSGAGRIGASNTNASANNASLEVQWLRGATILTSQIAMGLNAPGLGATSENAFVGCGCINYIDFPAAGTYTYKLQARSAGSTTTGIVANCVLVAYEST